MRSRWATAANVAAGCVVALLIVAALVLTARLGFAALAVLGLATWLICTRAALDLDVPITSVAVFRARMEQPRSPEERAGRETERQAISDPLKFVGRCGIVLTAIGVAGFAWQVWG